MTKAPQDSAISPEPSLDPSSTTTVNTRIDRISEGMSVSTSRIVAASLNVGIITTISFGSTFIVGMARDCTTAISHRGQLRYADSVLSGCDIICLSTQDWNGLWTRKQRFMQMFAR